MELFRKPLFNLEMKVADWLKQKKILIYGTYDQTSTYIRILKILKIKCNGFFTI